MAKEYEVSLSYSFEEAFGKTGEWDELVLGSNFNTIFLVSGWFRAWSETLGREANILIPQVRENGRLIAAAMFEERNRIVRFAGKGDYSDFVISSSLEPAAAVEVVELLITATKNAVKKFRFFLLTRIPAENRTYSYLKDPNFKYFVTENRGSVAPTMEMFAAEKAVKKKSLRRHERGLERGGDLQSATYKCASEIKPKLDAFFDQHIQRWEHTPFPSLFNDPENRAFYYKLTEYFDNSGWLRFTELKLNGSLIAAHFGFFHNGRFVWYKPTFDPKLSKRSPGEVLVKRLIEQARHDDAVEFDFTIGNETFKSRFATKMRELVDFHVTDSRLRATSKRLRILTKGILKTSNKRK